MSTDHRSPMEKLRARICIHCDHSTKKGGHYVPPSMGDPGFFACEAFCGECKKRATTNQERAQ